MYHGQHLRYYRDGSAPRVDGEDSDRSNELSRNTRSRALECPGDSRWYVGQATVPGATGDHYYAHTLNEWGQMLYEQGYIGTVAFSMVYPPNNNGRFNFGPDNYQRYGAGMRQNFLTEEDPDWGDWHTVNVDITQNLPGNGSS